MFTLLLCHLFRMENGLTFAAWALAIRVDQNRLVNLMGHGSKQMVFEVYGNYVEGLESK